MPIYDFACGDCGQDFEKRVRSADDAASVTCPECGGTHVRKKLSTFAVRGASSAPAAHTSAAACAPGGA
ncbi:MAG: zinc ribbon domain-containing protein [Chloroflexi bacterium]|nr:zinc ribbon domain-containing protein [Chloroflexota bacterium]